jgi:hypothetical protein
MNNQLSIRKGDGTGDTGDGEREGVGWGGPCPTSTIIASSHCNDPQMAANLAPRVLSE